MTAQQAAQTDYSPHAIIAGAGLNTIGSGISSAFNVHEARQNRRFQRDMSNTAHQREVADLRKAGLNPILSAKLGGASTPQGSVANVENPTSTATSAGQAVAQNQLAKAQTLSNIELQKSQAAVNTAQADNIRTQSILNEIGIDYQSEANPYQIKKLLAEIKNIGQQTKFSSAGELKTWNEIKALGLKMEELIADENFWKNINREDSSAGGIWKQFKGFLPQILQFLKKGD